MEWLVTISRDNHVVYIETKDISHISLLQQIVLTDREGVYYLVMIGYKNGSREQSVISDEVWQLWNQNNS